MASSQKFSMQEVLVTFRACLTEKQEILLDEYLSGWKELVRFMNSLGTAFSYVSSDVISKIQIMESYRKSKNGEKYLSLQSMVQYEVGNHLVDLTEPARHPESGCRTVLRLHRALQWLQLFLENLRISTKDSSTSALCSDAYDKSLANYHPWYIRLAARWSFYSLPSQATFFEIMNVGTADEVVAMLGEAVPLVAKVYAITQELYAQRNLLDLP